jgi:hypothetical protein
MTQLQLIIVFSLIALIVISGLFLLYPSLKWRYVKTRLNTIFNRVLFKVATYEDHFLIPDVHVKLPGNKDVVIDHLYFGDKYIYAIKDLYFHGGLLGKPQDQEWQYYDFRHRDATYRFIANPFLLQKQRIEKLSLVTGLDQSLFVSIILVNNDAMIHRIPESDKQEFILNIRHIEKFIQAFEKRDVPPFELDKISKAVLDIHAMNLENKPSKKAKKR